MKVSIIIPVYNIEAFIRRCLESVVSQSYTDLEIIVVNDGSTDQSAQIIDTFSADPRVHLIHKANEGLPSARAKGLSQATGEFVLHLDGDDSLMPLAIEQLVQKQEETKADIVFSNYYLEWENGQKKQFFNRFAFGDTGTDAIFRSFAIGALGLNIWGKLIRRSLYTNPEITIPFPLYYGEDIIQMVQLLPRATHIAFLATPILNYFQRSTAISFMKFKNAAVFFEYISWVENYLEQNSRIYTYSSRAMFVCLQFYVYLMKSDTVFTDSQFNQKLKSYLSDPFVQAHLGKQHRLLLSAYLSHLSVFYCIRTIIRSLKTFIK